MRVAAPMRTARNVIEIIGPHHIKGDVLTVVDHRQTAGGIFDLRQGNQTAIINGLFTHDTPTSC